MWQSLWKTPTDTATALVDSSSSFSSSASSMQIRESVRSMIGWIWDRTITFYFKLSVDPWVAHSSQNKPLSSTMRYWGFISPCNGLSDWALLKFVQLEYKCNLSDLMVSHNTFFPLKCRCDHWNWGCNFPRNNYSKFFMKLNLTSNQFSLWWSIESRFQIDVIEAIRFLIKQANEIKQKVLKVSTWIYHLTRRFSTGLDHL